MPNGHIELNEANEKCLLNIFWNADYLNKKTI